jgi:hypothetical protein
LPWHILLGEKNWWLKWNSCRVSAYINVKSSQRENYMLSITSFFWVSISSICVRHSNSGYINYFSSQKDQIL